MATSRTGTGQWRRVRQESLARGQEAGITHCPCTGPCKHHKGRNCGVLLDYQVTRTPQSAEPDHKRAWRSGGADTVANVRIICRRCNQSRGDRPLDDGQPPPERTTSTLVRW